MRKWLTLALVAVAAAAMGSNDAHKDFPGNQGGGNGAMMGFCRSGGKGVGFIPDSFGGTYAATCGNYNWSAESGGTTAGSADANGYQSATTQGGNSFYLSCTGAGAGTGSNGITYDVNTEVQIGAPTDLTAGAGSGASTWVDSAGGGSNDLFRGLILRITTSGGGPTVNTSRYITAYNAGTKTFTIDGTWPGGNPVNGATRAIIYDPIGSTCRAAGEVVKVNSMADIMLAQDHTRQGGTVYFPQLATATIASGQGTETGLTRATIYADELCGRKGRGVGLGSTFNTCPVMRPPSDEHFQRLIEQAGERTWEFEGSDTDGDQNGRTGVWIVTDTGSHFTDTTQVGRDDADGRIDSGWQGPKVGVTGGHNRRCAMTAGKCVPANNVAEGGLQEHGLVSNATAQTFTLGNSGRQITSNFCFSTQSAGTTGVCRADARVACSVGTDCSAVGLSATCDSPWSYLDFLVNTQKIQPLVMVQFNPEGFPENGASSDVQEVGYARINAVTATATGCSANNQNAAFQSYPAVSAGIRNGIGAQAAILDEALWEHNAAPMRGGTWSPNNYYGLDLNGNNASDPGDCLSGNTVSISDDEPECDVNEGLSMMSAMQGKLERFAVANCSGQPNDGIGSCFDGNVWSLQNQADNVTLVQSRRGAWADLSDISMKDFIVRDSPVTAAGVNNGVNIGFVSGARVDGLYFYNATATNLVFLSQGHNIHINHVRFESTNGNGFQLDYADGTSISDVQFLSHTGLLALVYTELANAEQFGPISFFNWSATGNNNLYNGGNVLAAIALSRLGGGDGTGVGATSSGVYIDNVNVNSNSTNLCLVSFDDDGTAGDGGPINVYRSKWRITNSSINNLNGTTGAKPICVRAHSGFTDSSTETGIFNERFQPSWVNLRANGVPIADQPYPQTQADNVNNGGFDCDVIDRGTVVHITNDITATGTCGDTDANHALEGGSTFRSICKCGAAGAWAPF